LSYQADMIRDQQQTYRPSLVTLEKPPETDGTLRYPKIVQQIWCPILEHISCFGGRHITVSHIHRARWAAPLNSIADGHC